MREETSQGHGKNPRDQNSAYWKTSEAVILARNSTVSLRSNPDSSPRHSLYPLDPKKLQMSVTKLKADRNFWQQVYSSVSWPL